MTGLKAQIPETRNPKPETGNPKPAKLDFLLAGVGGQGIVLMSDLLAEAALESGYDVKKSDVFGMAQRGGSVTSYVRIGERVYSPLPKPGDVEFLVGLEKLEAARWASNLRSGGTAIVNDYVLYPLSVSSGAERYPTDAEVVASFESRRSSVHLVDGTGMARELGNPKVLNVAVLGYLASLLSLPWEAWVRTVERRIPARFRALNLRALELGREAATARQRAQVGQV